ncbi:MAG: radical SAM protein [Kiritimatiellae bacterium]|nr:radical SAM protein [Kiritimatiellia bacterium]
MIAARLLWRWATGSSPMLLARFARAAFRSGRAVRRWRHALSSGRPAAPPFLFISITDECNLACLGCWVTPSRPPRAIEPATLDRLIAGWIADGGAPLIGLLGGEPLLYPALLEVIGRHPDAYFQVFTNGWRLDEAVARRFRQLRNVSPLISIEGTGGAADERRGARGAADRAWAAVAACRRHGLITGVATSLCRSNLADMTSEVFLRECVQRGVHYVWYYLYRPVGPRPAPELALDEQQIREVREFLVAARGRWPLLLVDSYWDEEGRAICPAAIGLSHHVGPGGDIEPCPVIQFAAESVGDGRRVRERIAASPFLATVRARLAEAGGGCMVLSDPAGLAECLDRVGARDTSGRGTARAELARMRPRSDHRLAPPVAERVAMYRRLKRTLFFGMSAYG